MKDPRMTALLEKLSLDEVKALVFAWLPHLKKVKIKSDGTIWAQDPWGRGANLTKTEKNDFYKFAVPAAKAYLEDPLTPYLRENGPEALKARVREYLQEDVDVTPLGHIKVLYREPNPWLTLEERQEIAEWIQAHG